MKRKVQLVVILPARSTHALHDVEEAVPDVDRRPYGDKQAMHGLRLAGTRSLANRFCLNEARIPPILRGDGLDGR
jgi:hypothetical protein